MREQRVTEPQRPDPMHPENMAELAPPLGGGGQHEADLARVTAQVSLLVNVAGEQHNSCRC